MHIDSKLREALSVLQGMIASGATTQQEIATATGVDQSQVSRILAGQVSRASTNVLKLCRYAGRASGSKSSRTTEAALKAAVLEVWDGTDQHADALCRGLRAIGELQAAYRARN